MSETKTPVEVAAEALAGARHEAKKQGMDAWPLTDVARAVFESVDVEGLAAEIGRHWLPKPKARLAYLRAVLVERTCACGHELRPQFFEWRHHEEHDRHVAAEIKSWLTGGGA